MTEESNLARRRAIAATLLAGTIGLTGAVSASAASRLGGVDMQGACNNQWPGMGLTATVTNSRNAYSWQCRSPWGYSQGINVNKQCAVQYVSGAVAGLGSTSNPYSWYCQR